MLWDGLIFVLIVTLAVAGWNVGIINSWRGPIALLVATLITQQFYIDFSTWIVQQLRMPPDQSVALGYTLMWCAIAIIVEILLSVLLPVASKNKPVFFERAGGAVFGLIRGVIIVLLPMVAMQGPMNKIPAAPPDKSALINPLESGIEKSALLPFFMNMAKGFYPSLKPIVVSEKAPSFKPNFAGTNAVDEMNKPPQ